MRGVKSAVSSPVAKLIPNLIASSMHILNTASFTLFMFNLLEVLCAHHKQLWWHKFVWIHFLWRNLSPATAGTLIDSRVLHIWVPTTLLFTSLQLFLVLGHRFLKSSYLMGFVGHHAIRRCRFGGCLCQCQSVLLEIFQVLVLMSCLKDPSGEHFLRWTLFRALGGTAMRAMRVNREVMGAFGSILQSWLLLMCVMIRFFCLRLPLFLNVLRRSHDQMVESWSWPDVTHLIFITTPHLLLSIWKDELLLSARSGPRCQLRIMPQRCL